MKELEEQNGSMHSGKTQKGRNEGGEEWADVGGMLATWGHGDVLLGLLLKARLGSLVSRWLGSVLMFMVPVATQCHDDFSGLGCLLWLCLYPRSTLPLGPY